MQSSRLRYTAIGALSIYWLNLVYMILHLIKPSHNVFPKPTLPQTTLAELLSSSILLLFLFLNQAIYEYRKGPEKISKKKIVPLLLFTLISAPIVFGYVFDSDVQSIGQTILNIGNALMDVSFDDLPPEVDPPGWDELDGTWATFDDGGNIVYYQEDNANKEALTIFTTSNNSWTNYTYEVDVKFLEGNTKKDDRGALLLFRYQGGNNYYFLWMKEGIDTLELHNRGDGAHMVTSTSFTLDPDTWYHVNITIIDQSVWVSVNDIPYFTEVAMNGFFATGNVAIGTSYYKVMFDNILVEPK